MSITKNSKLKHFSSLLPKLRTRKGVSQTELAKLLGVTQTTVHCWESARNLPSKRRLRAIADYFECDIDSLLSDDPQPRPYFLNLMQRTAEAEFTRILSLIHDNPNQLEALVKHLEEFRKEIENHNDS